MSDPVTTARTAREALARGLNALQSDPNVPPQLLDLAAPIAQAMGALHAIERSNGTQLVPHAEVALNHTRNALGQLQSQPATHVAVAQAMEAVASSLSSVHALSRMAAPPAAAPQPIPLQNPVQKPAAAPVVPAPAPQPAQAAYARDPFAAAPRAAAPAAAPGTPQSLHPRRTPLRSRPARTS